MMATDKQFERLEFTAILSRELPKESPHTVAVLADSIMAIARHHARAALRYCNGEMDGDEYERRLSFVRRKAEKMLPKGFKANFGGDPRGYTVKLILPSKRYNTWGGEEEGWGVPGS